MSYNIDTFKVKELNDFKIPVESLYKSSRKDWHFKRINQDDGSVVFENMESTILGSIKEGILFVSSINCCGEGSGHIMHDILMPAFNNSEGNLEAVCIWERGDSTSRLVVKMVS